MKGFDQLLESALLTDEVKVELKSELDGMIQEIKESAEQEAKVEYANKLATQQDKIAGDMMRFVMECVEAEAAELKDDLKAALAMEAKYATKLDEQVAAFTQELSDKFVTLVNEAVAEETQELVEEIKESKQNRLGIMMYESLKEQFGAFFEETDAGKQIAEAKADAQTAKDLLTESQSQVSALKAEMAIADLTDGLTGKAKSAMRVILEGVAVENLEKRYNETIDAVLKESVAPVSAAAETELEDRTILESVNDNESNGELDALRKRLQRLGVRSN